MLGGDKRNHFSIVYYFPVVWEMLVVNCCSCFLDCYTFFSTMLLVYFEPTTAAACPIDSVALLICIDLAIIQDV